MSVYLQHTAVVRVQVPMLVRCRHCGAGYVYELERAGHGVTYSGLFIGRTAGRTKAARAAEDEVSRQLADPRACDPVPCPECLLFQPHMRRTAAERRYDPVAVSAWVVWVVAGLVLLAAVVYLPADDPDRWAVVTKRGGVAAGVAAAGGGLYLLYRRLVAGYDPNRMSEPKRRRLARKRARRPDEFAAGQDERNRDEYQRQWEAARRAGEQPAPFVIDHWLPPDRIAGGGPVVVRAPVGGTFRLDLPPAGRTGGVYPVGSSGSFLVRVSAFRVHPDDAGPADD